MPRPNPEDVDRYHHLEGIPSQYRQPLYTRRLLYSTHANLRYARRVEHLVPEASRPTHIKAGAMQLLAADVARGKVVMQVWRLPLQDLEQDLVLAISDAGKVATVWVVARTDLDGIKRPKQSRAERRAARVARASAEHAGETGAHATGWTAFWTWARRAIRNVLTH